LSRSPQNVIETNIEAVKHGISVIIVTANVVLPLTLVIEMFVRLPAAAAYPGRFGNRHL
jgi:hypothetical protein